MDVGYFTICGGIFYGTVAVIMYTFVYWIEVVLGLPLGENEENPQDSYKNLKLLVQRIIEEVFKLPELFDYSGVKDDPKNVLPEFDPKKYEELLATAVLNKIVEGYNYEKKYESSGIHSGSELGNIGKRRLDVFSSSSDEPKSDTSVSDPSMSTPQKLVGKLLIDSYSNSESESVPHSPNSGGSSEYLSDYIQNHKVPLPNLIDFNQEQNGITESFENSENDGNWEENWLFQKRKQKNETIATAMLVPSPTEEVKTLIGDKSADEVSDLSEAGTESDDELSDNEVNLPHVLVESKTLIGGKNDVGPFDQISSVDELLQPDSLVSAPSLTDSTPLIMEAKNNLILIDNLDSVTNVPVNKSELLEKNDVTADMLFQMDDHDQSTIDEDFEIIERELENDEYDLTMDQVSESAKNTIDVPVPAPRSSTKTPEIEDEHKTDHVQLITELVMEPAEFFFVPTKDTEDFSNDQLLNYNSSESDSEFLLTSIPKLNTSSEETDESILHSIAHEDYICKVKPSEFDLSIDSVNSIEMSCHNNSNNGDNEIDKMDHDIIKDSYLSEDYVNDDPVVNAVYICSKPAIIVAVAPMNEDTPTKSGNEDNKNEIEMKSDEMMANEDKSKIDEIKNNIENIVLLEINDVKGPSSNSEPLAEGADIQDNCLHKSQEITNEEEKIIDTKDSLQENQGVIDHIEFEEVTEPLNSDPPSLQPSLLEEVKDQTELINIITSVNTSDTNQFTNQIYEQILEEKSNNVLFTTEEDNKSSSDKSEVRDIPGSIAEREHLKWKNAQQIPNNPYSAEALQRRLSNPPNSNSFSDVKVLNVEPRSLNSSIETITQEPQKPDPARYERDYYVNSPKNSTASQNNLNDYTNSSSEDDYIPVARVETPDISIHSYQSEIFTATPVLIEESDSKSDEVSKINSNLSDHQPSSLQDSSLTLSEDSETTRIYDLSKSETKILRHEVIRTSKRPEGAVLTPPPSPTECEVTHEYVDKFLTIQHLTELRSQNDSIKSPKASPVTSPISTKPSSVFNTNTGPQSPKFVAPRKKINYPYRLKMAEVFNFENQKVPVNGLADKTVIEEEVLSSLPSVKALAKTFSNNELTSMPPAFNRPKSHSWQSTKDDINDSRRSSGSTSGGGSGGVGNGVNNDPLSDGVLPPFYTTYHPVAPGHSITARSLSTKFRNELKNQNSTEHENIIDGHISPERPASPVLVPGKLKNNIAFFENLNK